MNLLRDLRASAVDCPAGGQAAEVTAYFESLHPAFSRALLYIILAFVVAALLWAGLGEVDVVATAPFRLAPLGRVHTVQAPRGGEIEQIDVKEGDRVAEGQVLFKLRSRETWRELRELEQARVRLRKAEYDLREALPQKRRLAQETIGALESRLQVMQALMRTHQEALEAYREEVGGHQIEGEDRNGASPDVRLEAEIHFRSAELEHLKQRYEQSRELYRRRLISRAALDEARVRYFGGLAALPARMAEVHRMEGSVQELKRQILEARIEVEREAAGALHAYEEAALRYGRAQQAVDRALDADSDLILAPEGGVITQVRVNTVGQVAGRGETLATLAPASAPMVAEAMIPGRDVGLVKPGQVVRLKYEAFPFGEYGIKRGRLVQVAPDATVDPALGPVFRGIVELEETAVRVRGEERPLMYGMKGSAEIVTDRQTVLDMLLRPLRQLRESARFASKREAQGVRRR